MEVGHFLSVQRWIAQYSVMKLRQLEEQLSYDKT